MKRLVDDMIAVGGHLESELEEALAAHRLTRPSFLVLDALERADGPLGQRELVAHGPRTAGNLSLRLRRLERAGLISRERDAADKRAVGVSLTDSGKVLVRAARSAYDERAERLTAPVDEPERLAGELGEWLAFFEPGEHTAPRLRIAVAPAAVAARMREAVGLDAHPGVLVMRVREGGAGDRAGLRRGDLIVATDHTPVRSVGDLDRAVRAAGTAITLDILRGVDEHRIAVDL